MTDIFPIEKKCAVCGHVQTFIELASTNYFGHMDLDTRPPGMARHTLEEQIQSCERCSYSNDDVSEPIDGVDMRTLEAADYTAFADSVGAHGTARSFLLAGNLHARTEQWEKAGMYHLKAAWTFDDLDRADDARKARAEAIRYFNKYIEQAEDINCMVIVVDLLRRIGEFGHAKEAAGRVIALDTGNDLIEGVLELEIDLCGKKDDRCHTLEKVR